MKGNIMRYFNRVVPAFMLFTGFFLLYKINKTEISQCFSLGEIIFIDLIGAIVLTGGSLMLLNPILPIFMCNTIGWHLKPNELGHDGCSFTGICPRCEKKVLRDSQGNWF